jgi:hypothetical protein
MHLKEYRHDYVWRIELRDSEDQVVRGVESKTRRDESPVCLTIVVVLSMLAPAVVTSSDAMAELAVIAALADAENMKYININDFEFDPLQGAPDLPEGTRFDPAKMAGLAYYLVQFDGPITRSMKEDLSGAGATILNYVSYNAFVARADRATIELAESLSHVRWVGLFEPAYKLSPRLAGSYDPFIDEFLRSALGLRPSRSNLRKNQEPNEGGLCHSPSDT